MCIRIIPFLSVTHVSFRNYYCWISLVLRFFLFIFYREPAIASDFTINPISSSNRLRNTFIGHSQNVGQTSILTFQTKTYIYIYIIYIHFRFRTKRRSYCWFYNDVYSFSVYDFSKPEGVLQSHIPPPHFPIANRIIL